MAKEKYQLEKVHCQGNPDVQCSEYTDYEMDNVVYRVWSAFEGEQDAVASLAALMLRKLESEEQAEETLKESNLDEQNSPPIEESFSMDIA